MIRNKNKLTPEYFYEEVAKKTATSKDIVKDIYTKYLSRVQELSKTDIKINVTGLGVFEVDPIRAFTTLYTYDAELVKREGREDYDEWASSRMRFLSRAVKHLNQLKDKYEYVEKSLDKFWANQRRLHKFIDREGNCRSSSERETGDLQELSKQEWN